MQQNTLPIQQRSSSGETVEGVSLAESITSISLPEEETHEEKANKRKDFRKQTRKSIT